MSTGERIKQLEEELKNTKYNKSTQHHIGLVKAKLARLKEKLEKGSSKGASKGFNVRRSGDATVILVGYPSVGKSTLLNKLTNANSQIGDYDFTTLDVIPGIMEYNDAKIQILDVPGIVQGAASGKGRGKEVLSILNNADIILILVDVFRNDVKAMMKELRDAKIRLNEKKPDVNIAKKARGGIDVGSTVKLTKIDERMIKGILMEFSIHNADVVIRQDVDVDQFIDVIESNRKYVKGIVVLNKIDLVVEKRLEELKNELKFDIAISADKGDGIEELKKIIFNKLDFIRVYCKQVGKKADLKDPLIVKKSSSIEDVCIKLHKDFKRRFKYARIWGGSVKFDGQQIRRLSHELKDGDIIEIHVT